MFGDSNASAGHDECRCGRDIEGALRVPSGPAGIYQHFVRLAASLWKYRRGVPAHRGRKSNEFAGGFALNPQPHQQSRNLRVACLSRQDLFHGRFSFGSRQIVAGYNFFQSFADRHRSTKAVPRGLTARPAGWLTPKASASAEASIHRRNSGKPRLPDRRNRRKTCIHTSKSTLLQRRVSACRTFRIFPSFREASYRLAPACGSG
jgi:hypothetical protein